jgi:hypothetical protein
VATNMLQAIKNLVEFNQNDLSVIYGGNNRINSVGVQLEYFVKDMFAGSFTETDQHEKDRKHSQHMSYLGNTNNPPDFIVFGGDAVEVKKITSANSSIALNSSYPKHKLYNDDPMITEGCRCCEDWSEIDIVYTVGVINKQTQKIEILLMVYGDCYAASRGVYNRIRDIIVSGINGIRDVELSTTRELGRINRVDPLGITYLRVRGMWGIENPLRVFDYIINHDNTNQFTMYAIMRESKYSSFPAENRSFLERLTNDRLSINDVRIKDPDNPAQYIPAKLIEYSIEQDL